MSIAFVSTMNKKLYVEYGRRFINEFIDNAHEDIKLFIIFEGNCPNEIINLKKSLKKSMEFIQLPKRIFHKKKYM